MLEPLISEGQAESVAKEIRFPNGSKIYLCHCQHEKDVFGFGSFEFHVLNIAEGGEFTPFMIKYLRSRVRISEEFLKRLPKKYLIPKIYWRTEKPEYSLPKVSITCNPIGPGKAELKRMFLARKPGEIWRAPDDEGGMLRQFIPAKLGDNPSLNPIEYASKLQGIGSKAYVEALLEGSWESTIGAFFTEITKEHKIKAFRLPDHWTKFMAMDWGACGDGDPFAIGWFAVSDGSIPIYPTNNLICYRIWHGKGLDKVIASDIARGVLAKERNDGKIIYRIAGGDIEHERGLGVTIFETFLKEGVHFLRADMRRAHGWNEVRERLVGKNSRPGLYFFEECEEALDELQALQYDPADPNDCIQKHDDLADMLRYACQSRPFMTKEPPKIEAVQGIEAISFNKALEMERRFRENGRL